MAQYFLTEQDLTLLKSIVADFKHRGGTLVTRGTTTTQTGLQNEGHQSPDVAIAWPPTAGIPARTDSTTPGVAECELYRIDDDGQIVSIGDFDRNVYNFSDQLIARDTDSGSPNWTVVWKTKAGKWVASPTGEGSSVTICKAVIATPEDGEVEPIWSNNWGKMVLWDLENGEYNGEEINIWNDSGRVIWPGVQCTVARPRTSGCFDEYYWTQNVNRAGGWALIENPSVATMIIRSDRSLPVIEGTSSVTGAKYREADGPLLLWAIINALTEEGDVDRVYQPLDGILGGHEHSQWSGGASEPRPIYVSNHSKPIFGGECLVTHFDQTNHVWTVVDRIDSGGAPPAPDPEAAPIVTFLEIQGPRNVEILPTSNGTFLARRISLSRQADVPDEEKGVISDVPDLNQVRIDEGQEVLVLLNNQNDRSEVPTIRGTERVLGTLAGTLNGKQVYVARNPDIGKCRVRNTDALAFLENQFEDRNGNFELGDLLVETQTDQVGDDYVLRLGVDTNNYHYAEEQLLSHQQADAIPYWRPVIWITVVTDMRLNQAYPRVEYRKSLAKVLDEQDLGWYPLPGTTCETGSDTPSESPSPSLSPSESPSVSPSPSGSPSASPSPSGSPSASPSPTRSPSASPSPSESPSPSVSPSPSQSPSASPSPSVSPSPSQSPSVSPSPSTSPSPSKSPSASPSPSLSPSYSPPPPTVSPSPSLSPSVSPTLSPSVSPSVSPSPSLSPSASPSPSGSPSASPSLSPSLSPEGAACGGCVDGFAPIDLNVTVNGVGEAFGCNDRCLEKLDRTVTCRITQASESFCEWRFSDYLIEDDPSSPEEMYIYVRIGHSETVNCPYWLEVEVHLTSNVCEEGRCGSDQGQPIAPFWFYRKCQNTPFDCMDLLETVDPDYDNMHAWFWVNWDDDRCDPGCDLNNSTVTVTNVP